MLPASANNTATEANLFDPYWYNLISFTFNNMYTSDPTQCQYTDCSIYGLLNYC